jgi:Mlc titration factor MtfA (ptsG expression regulator)
VKLRWIEAVVLAIAVGGAALVISGPAAGAVAFVLAVVVFVVAFNYRTFTRSRVDREPFPEPWREVLEAYVDFYEDLEEPADKKRFERDVRYFVEEHTITGPRGEEVEDELKVLVGASAAILSFGKPGYVWGRVRDVVVYPDAFDDDYEISEGGNILGQVGSQGPIIFSARALRQGFRAEHDGMNVGIHELAHVLDFGDGSADGVPSLMPWSAVRGWLNLVHDEVSRIEEHESVLREYGATNEAEFFAVATEVFFERPTRLREEHPELYAMLRDVYGQDPASPRRDGDDGDGGETPEERRRRRRNERKRRRRAKD